MVFGIDKDVFWILIIFVPITMALIISIIKEIKGRKQALKELMEDTAEELPLVTAMATVISKRADICYGGGAKAPTHKICFFVTFSVNGTAKEFEVTEGDYNKIEENKCDVLVTVNGKFFAFGEAK